MAKTDPELGQKVKEHLTKLGLETLTGEQHTSTAFAYIQEGISGFLHGMGLDVHRDPSIKNTPQRVAEMYVNELCYGLNYDNFPKCTAQPNGTLASHHPSTDTSIVPRIGAVDEMVIVRGIQTITLCEHHFQTITGVTHIAYLPGQKLLGLSKFARVTNFFARRPQVQERMTEQIYAALSLILETEDVAVVQAAVHNCMRARGVMDPSSDTITSKMGGRFRENQATREELLGRLPL